MKLAKTIARKVVFPVMIGLRINELIRNLVGDSYLNLMYHGVVERDSTYFSPRHINAVQFEKQLLYFKNNFDVISIREAFELVRNNLQPKRKTVTLSFDDGYKNNLDTALPLLEKYEIPATFFISSTVTQNMNIRCLWTDIIATLNYFHKNEIIKLGSYRFTNLFDEKKRSSLIHLLKSSAYHERNLLLGKLIERYNLEDQIKLLDEEIWKIMTVNELIKLSQSKFAEIGSHGHLHYNLSEIGIDMAKEELSYSKKLLEDAIGKEVDLIAFPDGSYNEEVKDMAEKIGYKGQLAVDYKTTSDLTDKRIMNRHQISATTNFESNIISLNWAFKYKGIKI